MTEKARRQQIQIEIEWIKDKLKSHMSEAQRKTYLHQIRKKEYDLEFGIFNEET